MAAAVKELPVGALLLVVSPAVLVVTVKISRLSLVNRQTALFLAAVVAVAVDTAQERQEPAASAAAVTAA